ncbi:MAG TPA: DUF885 family protein, partial [Pyrinomonadaceae bacterium]|nr:DUF885 family protein [Pyrinomonadaceae bacterium]
MNRKLFAPAVALALLLCGLPSASSAQGQRARRVAQRPARGNPSGAQNARVAALADEYLRGFYAFHPTRATAAGLHQHDQALESRSRESVAREARRLRGALAELSRVREWLLSAEARYDLLVLQSHARAQLLELEETAPHRRDPGLYARLASASVDNVLKRAYAPVEQRLDAVLARERQIPRLLEEARLNLEDPPRLFTERAAAETRGSLEFFARAVPQMLERAGGGRLSAARRAEFDSANSQTLAALRSYLEWLERDLLPRSNGDYRLGAELLRRKLLYEEMVDAPPARLVVEGEGQLRRTQEQMRAVAEEVAPGRGLPAALELLARERPSAEGLVGETRAALDRVRAFVRVKELLSAPARESLSVAETPEYARARGFASLDAPGAFERASAEAFYYVTPPDPVWDARRREEHLSLFNAYALPLISAHEVTGHYNQLLAAHNSTSRVRAVLRAPSFVEGWAHYCEQMLVDEGFGGNNPRLRLAQLQLALLRLCRYVAALRVHAGEMTYEQAIEFFAREGFQARTNAEREARRVALEPSSFADTLGKLEILALREEWRARMGESFRLGEFHDRLLSYGAPPLRVLRMALLGDARTSAAAPSPSPAARNSSAQAEQPSAVEFSVLALGQMSGYEGGRTVELITDEAGWRRVWSLIGNGAPLPEVNFNTRAVVVVFQGQKPTGGYGVSIEEIRRAGTVLAVQVNERRPGAGDVTIQVITSPFVAASIPRPLPGTVVNVNAGGRDGDVREGANENPTVRKG